MGKKKKKKKNPIIHTPTRVGVTWGNLANTLAIAVEMPVSISPSAVVSSEGSSLEISPSILLHRVDDGIESESDGVAGVSVRAPAPFVG